MNADIEPVYDDGVCDSAHVQALRVRIADPSRMWAAGPSIGTAEEVMLRSCPFRGQDSKTFTWQLRIQSIVGAAPGMVCRASFATMWPRSMDGVELRVVCVCAACLVGCAPGARDC